MWHLHGNIAQLQTQHLELHFSLANPWLGCTPTRLFQAACTNRLGILQAHLQQFVHLQNPVTEVYIRGNDVVLSYSPIPHIAEPIYWQLYYRSWDITELQVTGVELILSAHTASLHSQPAMQLKTQYEPHAASEAIFTRDFPGVQDAAKNAQITLYRPHSENFSYLEWVDSSDYAGLERKGTEVSWSLFPDSLEKGVIRRVRACGWFLPRENDWNSVNQALHHYGNAPIPLTT